MLKPKGADSQIKFRTCARVRAKENQKLGHNFYTKESSKPIFKKMKLLTAKNLYRQRCTMEIFKIIKYKVPVSMISLVRNLSAKNASLLPLSHIIILHTNQHGYGTNLNQSTVQSTFLLE